MTTTNMHPDLVALRLDATRWAVQDDIDQAQGALVAVQGYYTTSCTCGEPRCWHRARVEAALDVQKRADQKAKDDAARARTVAAMGNRNKMALNGNQGFSVCK